MEGVSLFGDCRTSPRASRADSRPNNAGQHPPRSPSLSPTPHPSAFNPKHPTFLPPTRSTSPPRAQTAPHEGSPVCRRRCVAGLSRGWDWEMGMLWKERDGCGVRAGDGSDGRSLTLWRLPNVASRPGGLPNRHYRPTPPRSASPPPRHRTHPLSIQSIPHSPLRRARQTRHARRRIATAPPPDMAVARDGAWARSRTSRREGPPPVEAGWLERTSRAAQLAPMHPASRRRAAAAAVLAIVCSSASPAQTFRLSFPAATHATPITGRAFVFVARTNTREPRLQSGPDRGSEPFFGTDVTNLAPGQAVTIDQATLGFPIASLARLPAGDYYVQGLILPYTEFHRSDGHTIWAHMDAGEGQRFNASPGSLVSDVRENSHRSREAPGRLALADHGDPARRALRGHAVGEARPHHVPAGERVLGSPDAARRRRPPAQGLRPGSGAPVSRSSTPSGTTASIRPSASRSRGATSRSQRRRASGGSPAPCASPGASFSRRGRRGPSRR